ncbi:MAG: hypothetical protein U1E33_02605 [Rhodospirillales bacterium]
MNTNIVLQPMLPEWLLLTVLAPALLLLLVAIVRRARGWSLRALALLALGAALLDPRIVSEQRQARPDLALVVIDQSASQQIGDRAAVTAGAAAELRSALAGLDGVEVRTISAGDAAAGDTRLFDAIERAALDDASGRLAAVFVVSDGQVHDVPAPGSARWLTAPLHLLLTGRPDERDRRLAIEQAPAFGLVDQHVEVAFRVEDSGGPSSDAGRARVDLRIDGTATGSIDVAPGQTAKVPVAIRHPGPTVLELEVQPAAGEISTLNNRAAVVINGVRERLRVLLVSGQPHPGERTWRNLLKSDPAVDLVHFTILRPPEKDDATPLRELSLIVFPVQELFENKLYDFDLVVLDRYVVRGILPTPYYGRIAEYVRQGGALLAAVGPEFASAQSLFRTPLGEVLPASPTGRVIEQAFRPEVSDVGHRHPVTSGLPGERPSGDSEADDEGDPTWGRWFRLVEGQANAGTTLMTGADAEPLLVVDRVGEGRVAQLMSDQIWLWARGFEGGGPQAELLRRLAHWLMKEPELEEEHLEARIADGRLSVRRRSLASDPMEVQVTDPSGATTALRLEDGADGIARGEMRATQNGLWRISDGVHTALAAAGRLDPPEMTDLRATASRLAPLVSATGGGTAWIADRGLPDLRRVASGRPAAGDGWLGVQRNQAYAVTGVAEVPLLPALLLLATALGGLAGAWWREGR